MEGGPNIAGVGGKLPPLCVRNPTAGSAVFLVGYPGRGVSFVSKVGGGGVIILPILKAWHTLRSFFVLFVFLWPQTLIELCVMAWGDDG